MTEPAPAAPAMNYAHLADAPVSQKKAAWTVTALLILVAPVGQLGADWMYETANRTPETLRALRDAADPVATGEGEPRPAVVLLIDGMRADEAARLPAWRRLRRERDVATAIVALPLPTLSTPYYHALLTGVPPDGTGVRTNRYKGRARLDSLPDRVRARGGSAAWVTEDLDWFPRMFARRGDRVATAPDALGPALRDELARLGSGRGATFTLIHVVSVDDTAHAAGIDAEAHRVALRVADRVLAQTERAARAAGAVLLVVGDHGHIRNGGHGGDEPDVQRAPFLLRAPGLMRGDAGEIRVEQIASTLAGWMNVQAPRSGVARAPSRLRAADVGQRPGTGAGTNAAPSRQRLLEDGVRLESARRSMRRAWMLLLTAFVLVCLVGATKRAFRGFDAGSLLGPLAYLSGVLALHDGLLDRPLTLSAIDDIDRHAPRLFWIGSATALFAIGIGVAAWRRRPDLRDGKAALAERLRRTTAATGLAAVATFPASVAWAGGALGPWPVSAFTFYAPVLTGVTMIGACATCSAVMAVAAALTPRDARSRAGP